MRRTWPSQGEPPPQKKGAQTNTNSNQAHWRSGDGEDGLQQGVLLGTELMQLSRSKLWVAAPPPRQGHCRCLVPTSCGEAADAIALSDHRQPLRGFAARPAHSSQPTPLCATRMPLSDAWATDVATGLPSWNGAQLAVDTTSVSRDAVLRSRRELGTACRFA